ncbi:hypothetical protein [Labrys sp. ZIDIC5]|uniref:hypothetical protein n=1 Tax=Labrys sedimenti TaxID=3106036 RepID=UPI002ACA941B|nr:hypothetical protein [Labrys sp. ZIDIC5]MDZ5452705.1 hypothetical protein [Labrys sp. ZIDIC5]
MRSIVALMAFLAAATQAQAAPSMAQHFARCEPEFFEALRDYIAHNGPATRDSVVTKAGTWDELVLAKPVRAHGFDIRAYRQLQSTLDSKPTSRAWQWGLVIEAKPRAVAYAIDPYLRKIRATSEGLGLRAEANGWSTGLGAYKGGRWRQVRVATLEDGKATLLSCFTFNGDYPDFPGLPDPASLAASRN